MPHTQQIKAKVSFLDGFLVVREVIYNSRQFSSRGLGVWRRSGAARELLHAITSAIFVCERLTCKCLSAQGNAAYQANMYGAPYEASHAQHAGRWYAFLQIRSQHAGRSS